MFVVAMFFTFVVLLCMAVYVAFSRAYNAAWVFPNASDSLETSGTTAQQRKRDDLYFEGDDANKSVTARFFAYTLLYLVFIWVWHSAFQAWVIDSDPSGASTLAKIALLVLSALAIGGVVASMVMAIRSIQHYKSLPPRKHRASFQQ